MNVFTDDKLRIYKNVMLSQTAPIYVSHSELEALLARLEAAEAVAYRLLDSTRQCSKETADIIETWTKAAGK